MIKNISNLGDAAVYCDFGLEVNETINSNVIDYFDHFSKLIKEFPETEFGAHLHSNNNSSIDKLNAAYQAGCRRFDGSILGVGGCPMAKDELVGNIPSEKIIDYLQKAGENLSINKIELETSINMGHEIFN